MKTSFIARILFVPVIILIIVSCGSGNHFASRKYQPGKYIAHTQKPDKVKTVEKTETEPVYADVENDIPTTIDVKKEPVYADQQKEVKPIDEIASKVDKDKAPLITSLKLAAKEFHTKDILKHIITQKDKTSSIKNTVKGEETSHDATGLVGFILGILGVAADILGIVMVIGTLEYTFVFLFLIGLFLGIGGLIFGTKGLRNHHKNGGPTVDLVFSIIGTVFGGVSILLALIFSFYSLIFYLVGL